MSLNKTYPDLFLPDGTLNFPEIVCVKGGTTDVDATIIELANSKSLERALSRSDARLIKEIAGRAVNRLRKEKRLLESSRFLKTLSMLKDEV